MNTPATIVLNKEALNALFPEGSEARVQLATSAIKSLATSTIKPTYVSDAVIKLIDEARSSAVADVLKGHGVTAHYSGGRHIFSDDFKRSLRTELTGQLAGMMKTEAQAAIKNAMEDVPAAIATTLHNLLNAEINRQVGDKLKTAVAAALNSVKVG